MLLQSATCDRELDVYAAEQRSTEGLGKGVALFVLGLARAIFFFLSVFFGSLGHKQARPLPTPVASTET